MIYPLTLRLFFVLTSPNPTLHLESCHWSSSLTTPDRGLQLVLHGGRRKLIPPTRRYTHGRTFVAMVAHSCVTSAKSLMKEPSHAFLRQ